MQRLGSWWSGASPCAFRSSIAAWILSNVIDIGNGMGIARFHGWCKNKNPGVAEMLEKYDTVGMIA